MMLLMVLPSSLHACTPSTTLCQHCSMPWNSFTHNQLWSTHSLFTCTDKDELCTPVRKETAPAPVQHGTSFKGPETLFSADLAPCCCWLCRLVQPPLRLNPEDIVQGSGLEALQVTSFLGENYPHFMSDEAMEEAAQAAAYLSDAGRWRDMGGRGCGLWWWWLWW